MMLLRGRRSTRSRWFAGMLLVLVTMPWGSLPAHADIISAFNDFKKGDYPHAFQEFLALAKLGDPLAQFDVAAMYQDGHGAPQSDINAYAWAALAAENGNARGKELADEIRPKLAPGDEQAAAAVTAAYTDAVLQQTLLPDLSQGPPVTPPDPTLDCNRSGVKMYRGPYPVAARMARLQGAIFVEFTVMPDGTPRFPRIIEAVPAGIFEGMVRDSLLRSRLSPAPAGSAPVQCTVPYNFLLTGHRVGGARDSMDDFETQLGYRSNLENLAQDGAPEAQLVYGLLLDGPFKEAGVADDSEHAGLRWLIKAAQAGAPVAQFEVAHDLLLGRGCRRDERKGLKWLQMAAEQDEPDADITLATRLLRGTPSAGDVTQAKGWLERVVGQREDDGIPNSSQDARLLLAAILAATPQASLRDPARALDLLKEVHDVDVDPTPFEVAAAAQAAEANFSDAARSEQAAISRAGQLGWDLAPLQQRLSLYQSGKPWYGSLLQF